MLDKILIFKLRIFLKILIISREIQEIQIETKKSKFYQRKRIAINKPAHKKYEENSCKRYKIEANLK